jgi:hypothetical protein
VSHVFVQVDPHPWRIRHCDLAVLDERPFPAPHQSVEKRRAGGGLPTTLRPSHSPTLPHVRRQHAQARFDDQPFEVQAETVVLSGGHRQAGIALHHAQRADVLRRRGIFEL